MFLNFKQFKEKYPKYKHIHYMKTLVGSSLKAGFFPMKPIDVFIINCNEFFSQPFQTPDGKSWVIVKISDWSLDVDIKSQLELIAGVIKDQRYSKFNYPKHTQNIDFIVKASDGTLCSRGNLTHEEYLSVIKKESPLDKSEREQKIIAETKRLIEYYLNTVPHIERPFMIYVVGCDDSSYSMTYPTLKLMMKNINKWKKAGFLNENKWHCYFTN